MAETFGKTDKGGTEFTHIGSDILMSTYPSGSAGTLASLSVYVKYHTVESLMKCAIYDSSFNLLSNGETEEKNVTSGQDDWMEFAFSTPPSVSATTGYYLAFWGNQPRYVYRDPDAAATKYKLVSYDSWPDPFTGYSASTKDYSIFATYSEAPPAKKTLVQAALISIPPLIVLPTLGQILKLTGGC